MVTTDPNQVAQLALQHLQRLVALFARDDLEGPEVREAVDGATTFLQHVLPQPNAQGEIEDPSLRVPDPHKRFLRRFCPSCHREITRSCMVILVEQSTSTIVALPPACPFCAALMFVETPPAPRVLTPDEGRAVASILGKVPKFPGPAGRQ
jgi:hypothetical protein